MSAGVFLRTLRRITPRQVLWRPWHRIAPDLVRYVPEPAVTLEARRRIAAFALQTRHLDESEIDVETARAVGGIWSAIGIDVRADLPPLRSAQPRLWQYEMHYRRWLAGAARQLAGGSLSPDTFERWWREALRSSSEDRIPWEPYVLSRRIWSELSAAGTLDREDIAASALRAGRALRKVPEHHLGANHLLANRAAIAAVSLLDNAATGPLRTYEQELSRQIDAEGLHEERSPHYALLVLQDLVRVRTAAAIAGAAHDRLDVIEASLARALSRVLRPDGSMAAFHDTSAWSSMDARRIGVTALTGGGGWTLPSSGFCGWTGELAGEVLSLVADFGSPRPRHQPGHQHAAPFAIDLWWGRPWITSVGISTYEANECRLFERGAAAHSTLQLGALQPAEIWSAFRMGSGYSVRGRLFQAAGDGLLAEGEHDGWVGMKHRRRIAFDASARRLTITDHVAGRGEHTLTSRLILAPGISGEVTDRGVELRCGSQRLTCRSSGGGVVTIEPVTVYPTFGLGRESSAVVLRNRAALPSQVSMELSFETTS